MGSSEALSNFITTFLESVNTDGLWATLGSCVPLIAISVLFGLGVYLVIRVLKALVKGKGV